MKTKFKQILTLLLVFVMQISFAQEKTITGTVSDESGSLPNVSVLVKGTSEARVADSNGKYSIKVKAGDVLVFSYLGYKTLERTVGIENIINVKLEQGSNNLDEVIVLGYGKTTKKSYTGTATVVSKEKLEAKSFSNVTNSLIGEVAGVTVINGSGQPGSVGTVRIRGFGSVNGNRSPLYVVDGVVYIGGINSINPADIETTTILKDASATAIYGSRGSNGVILISTKKGASAKTFIEVESKMSVNDQLIPRYDVISNPEQWVGLVWEGLYNRGVATNVDPIAFANGRLLGANGIGVGYNMWNVATAADLIDPLTATVRPGVTRKFTPERYVDEAISAAMRNETNLRMGGGSKATNYYASFGYLEDKGIIINSDYKRYTSRLNLNSQIKPWVKVGANVGHTFSRSTNNGQTNGAENIFEFADKMAPVYPVFERDANGNKIVDPIYGGFLYDYGPNRPNSNSLNPIASALYDLDRTEAHELNANFDFDFKISENFSFLVKYGAQYSTYENRDFTNPFYGPLKGDGGTLGIGTNQYLNQNFQQILKYNKSWGNHSLDVLAAHESLVFDNNYIYQSAKQMASPFILELNNFITVTSTPSGYNEGFSVESYFGQINYSFDNKYFFSGSLRTDGSSRYLNDNKWGNFGSIGAAWDLSKENFLKDNNLIKFLKLKSSYGITGDQNGVGYYSGYDSFGVSNLAGSVSISPTGNGNPNLTWETSKMFQVGAEFTLGKFLDGSLDYYSKKTEDLIFSRRVGPSAGIAIITVNDGELMNKGLEFDLTGHLVKNKDFSLDLTVNGAFLNNELITMPLDPATGNEKYLDTQGVYAWSKGRSIFDFFLREWAGVDPSDGTPMWYQYYDDKNDNGILDAGEPTSNSTPWFIQNPDNPSDLNNNNQTASIVEYQKRVSDTNIKKQVTKTYSDASQVYNNKSSIPKLQGAFRLASKIHDFDFSAQFTYSMGGYAYDGQYAELMQDRFGAGKNNFHTDITNRWRKPGDITNVPRLADATDIQAISASTRFLTKSDYIALNNLKVGYTLNNKMISNLGIESLNVWLAGDNLFQSTARAGFLPNTSETGSSGRALYAPVTTLTLGVRVKF